MELFVLIFNAVIPYFSKGKQVHRVCHLQAEDLSKHRLFKPGIKTRGMAAWQWRGDKVHLQQQRCVLNPEHYYVTINTRKYTPSSETYPCLTLSQAISQLFNQSNYQLVIHQSIYQSNNLVSQSVSHWNSQSVSHWNSQSVIIESVKQSVTHTIKNHSVSFLSTCISLSTIKAIKQ